MHSLFWQSSTYIHKLGLLFYLNVCVCVCERARVCAHMIMRLKHTTDNCKHCKMGFLSVYSVFSQGYTFSHGKHILEIEAY
jgi:hypothetical protein